MKIKKALSLLLVLVSIFTFTVNTFAIDYTGTAVYRDGVTGGEWHAGISTNSVGDQIGMARGLDELTDNVSLSIFINPKNTMNNNFKGYYCKDPDGLLTDKEIKAIYTSIASTAKSLGNAHKPYTLLLPMDIYAGSGSITTSRIASLRCDGFAEYCYEYNGTPVMSFVGKAPNYKMEWNISTNDGWYAHCFYSDGSPAPTRMTPKTQAGYMSKLP